MALLLDLPNELLTQIFAHLNTVAPSTRYFDDLPAFHESNPQDHPLKSLSLTCCRLRKFMLGCLFARLRTPLESVDKLLKFVKEYDLAPEIESVVIEVRSVPPSEYKTGKPSWWWGDLLEQIPQAQIIVQFRPEGYSAISTIEVNLTDAWMFKIPCQYIEFGRPPISPGQVVHRNKATDLFAARQWQSLRINEGSSLAAYTSYEYFLKRQPSLLGSLGKDLNPLSRFRQQPVTSTHEWSSTLSTLPATVGMFEMLRTFSYTAIFPFYNHVDEVLNCIKTMTRLQSLFMKLCPNFGSTVLEDAMQAALGHIDLNDPWNEYVPFCTHITAIVSNKSNAGRKVFANM